MFEVRPETFNFTDLIVFVISVMVIVLTTITIKAILKKKASKRVNTADSDVEIYRTYSHSASLHRQD